ncbi:MAG: cysteine peptidase family C39 domain-containing protein, partial [Candidatus Zixiibacteriota bacterium]
MNIFVFFVVFGFTDKVLATQVEVVQRKLLVNGEPFLVKGVNYSPTPIGIDPETTYPYGDYFTSKYSSLHDRDLPLLRQMGANTIRIINGMNGSDHTDFLDKAYHKGNQPIYVIIAFSLDPAIYPDISSSDARQKIKADFRAMVSGYKNHPAVLMWSIGNELNSPKMYGDKLNDLFSLINEMAHEAHKEEGAYYHPVTTPLADIDLLNTIATYEPLMLNIDIWGANIYRGSSFGSLFNDLKKISIKPLLVMGFGVDAYDENAGGEYENGGIPYQATYAESLWKEISANSEVCSGGIIRAYSDEWWLGKFGNTLEGCPDLDPSLQSPCGHPSNSDPDGFVNYEWLGIMRVKKNGSNLDIVEPRKVYHTLKSLWTDREIVILSRFQSQSLQKEILIEAESGIPAVSLSVKPLDLTNAPTVEEIMAAGQLGGQLYPTHELKDKDREKKVNLSFGEAIQEWNKHEYKKAIELFKKHLQEYPDSPWASEAVLHIGCDAYYNGRHTEAEESFNWILDKNKGKAHEGAKALVNKARSRLAILKVYQNNFKEATEHFATLRKEGSDWRDRTYASAWIQRLSLYNSNKLAMLNCGTRALAYLLEKEGKEAEARKVIGLFPETLQGHSIKGLSDIASRYGYNVAALRISISDLKSLPLPSIMHLNGKSQDDSGHYWILEKVEGEKLDLFDPQSGFRFEQRIEEFSKKWNGNAIVFSDRGNLPGVKLAENEMEQF